MRAADDDEPGPPAHSKLDPSEGWRPAAPLSVKKEREAPLSPSSSSQESSPNRATSSSVSSLGALRDSGASTTFDMVLSRRTSNLTSKTSSRSQTFLPAAAPSRPIFKPNYEGPQRLPTYRDDALMEMAGIVSHRATRSMSLEYSRIFNECFHHGSTGGQNTGEGNTGRQNTGGLNTGTGAKGAW